jgi:hypothetical protein
LCQDVAGTQTIEPLDFIATGITGNMLARLTNDDLFQSGTYVRNQARTDRRGGPAALGCTIERIHRLSCSVLAVTPMPIRDDAPSTLTITRFTARARIAIHGFTEMEIVAPEKLQLSGMQQFGSPAHGPVGTSVSQSNVNSARLKTAEIPVFGSHTAATGRSSKIGPDAQFWR